ncbi:MAG TPA: HepT-like ribonuclease domain-containing protein [Roseiarcus sp.]|nr:HepT-like ribonuclease domain-containing protein [Roseiarcus sp.]
MERIESYVGGRDRASLARDGRTRDAVERCFERVCEAAFRLGDQAERLMPNQPWADIRGMGNRLRHAYDRISLEVIWNSIQEDLPSLAAESRLALERIRRINPK